MTSVDQFESVFRSAVKAPFEHRPVTLQRVVTVTDLPREKSDAFREGCRALLGIAGDEVAWHSLAGPDFADVATLLEKVLAFSPDLVCTWRCLHSNAHRFPYTLGQYLDVLVQRVDCPVLVVPHPEDQAAFPTGPRDTDSVMALTQHLTGDHRLVNQALRFTEADGTLHLAHVEDDATFEQFMAVIGKIPSIDTETAREEILHQLLKEPHDYITSCRQAIEQHGLRQKIGETVTVGHRLTEYRRLIDEHEVDLLVMNSRDEDQMAMHGLAYPLAVELRDLPLLLL